MNHGYSTYSGASSAGMPGMTTFVMTPTLFELVKYVIHCDGQHDAVAQICQETVFS